MKKEEIIKTTSLFEGLAAEDVEAVSNLIFEKKFGKGETIFFEGDEADGAPDKHRPRRYCSHPPGWLGPPSS